MDDDDDDDNDDYTNHDTTVRVPLLCFSFFTMWWFPDVLCINTMMWFMMMWMLYVQGWACPVVEY